MDEWIFARLNDLVSFSTLKLDEYKLLEPTRAIKDFVDDLSTWYLRRSRERIKNENVEAKQTLYVVLKELTKLMAPFAPFVSEDLYQKLRTENDPESVHLENWPKSEKIDRKILDEMKEVRRFSSLALEARSKANIKVRQPLSELKIKSKELGVEFLNLIQDELNVKRVTVDENLASEVELDTHLTPELLEEGKVRDAIRAIQEMRKEKGLKPKDKMKF
ncbi:MAG: class I tRNA ligase family protein, partial [Patescibacteria group bacterium]|nr:class I tRNA ligase family protein [Patescibacteria group bacterium]